MTNYGTTPSPFVPLTEDDRAPSLELLVPPAHSKRRTTFESVATTSIMASMFGGGMLTIPYAFGQVGLAGAVLMQLFSGIASAYSLYMLVAASRRTGDTTFTSLTANVLGGVAEKLLGAALLMDLILVMTTYLMLIRDVLDVLLGPNYDNL